MRRILIGHRGTGKTSLLKRHQEYFPEVEHFDLDHEIEKFAGMTISQYFADKGEAAFRKLERSIFQKLIEKSQAVISVGAGFDTSFLPPSIETVFVSRKTDLDGRIFLNRPRLEPQMTALDEYKKRYAERNSQFIQQATWTYDLPEGVEAANSIEKQIFQQNFQIRNAYVTLTEKDRPRFQQIELRTDLLKPEAIQKIISENPTRNFLLSIRSDFKISKNKSVLVDCDLKYFNSEADIVSSHIDNIDEALQKFSELPVSYHFKLCPLIESFEDLIRGYRWQQQDPENRSFLPRSKNGRWVWYRQLAKYLQKINFVKSFPEVLDQPSVYEWLSLPETKPEGWAAVLGSPVYFSRSPQQHFDFFNTRKSFFTRIDLSPDELKNHHGFLTELGLKYAAVTSPLKETLYGVSDIKTVEAQNLKSANTLLVKNKKLNVHNTDAEGFRALIKTLKPADAVAIWGGGGTLEMLKQALPQATLFSSQTGQTRAATNEQITHFKALVWAAPRTSQTQFPSAALNFDSVIDLNYSENSMGLEFAANRKISYISGLEMFKVQAKAQQVFWQAQEGLS